LALQLINKSNSLSDSYGSYKIIIGYEGSGRCWWCGGTFPDRRARRFCTTACRRRYEENFYWSWASMAAIRRARFRCKECGLKGKRRLQVHHIIPLNGTDRLVNALNRRENLAVLCKECHRKKHQASNDKQQSL